MAACLIPNDSPCRPAGTSRASERFAAGCETALASPPTTRQATSPVHDLASSATPKSEAAPPDRRDPQPAGRADALHHASHRRRGQRRGYEERGDREPERRSAEVHLAPHLDPEPARKEGREHGGGRDSHRKNDGASVQSFARLRDAAYRRQMRHMIDLSTRLLRYQRSA